MKIDVEKLMAKKAKEYEDKYNLAKATRVGSNIICPVCDRTIVKTTYHKVFCSNQKTRKHGNCKDTYWNIVDEVRRIKLLQRNNHELTDPELITIKNLLNM